MATGGAGGPSEASGGRAINVAGGGGERVTRGLAPKGFLSADDSRSRTRKDIARGSSESVTPGGAALLLGTVVISSHAHFTSLHLRWIARPYQFVVGLFAEHTRIAIEASTERTRL